MIGKLISHYPPKADPPPADKILKKLGEGSELPNRSGQVVPQALQETSG